MDRIADFLSELPIGLIIFIIALALGMFGRDKDAPQEARPPRQAARQPGPPPAPSTFASDDRRAREQRALRQQQEQREVITFGGLEFGSRDALFRDDEPDTRRGETKFGFDKSEWGQTKYGFDESEWGSSFGERKNPDPIIR